MTITDLPSTIPNPPDLRGDGTSDDVHLDMTTDGPVIERAGDGGFSLEFPEDEPVLIEVVSKDDASPLSDAPTEDAPDTEAPYDPEADSHGSSVGEEFASTLARSMPPARPALPSYAVVIIGGLALACLALCVALVTALTSPEPTPPPIVTATPEAIAAPGTTPEPTPAGQTGASATPADFPAPPAPIPVDLITALEAASSEPLEVELSRLLEAIQHGFGGQSARLEPTLRSYVYRMAARFEWNPNTFRVAATAPDARLAEARKALLESLFEEAVGTGRLAVGTGTGPHALTLVTE